MFLPHRQEVKYIKEFILDIFHIRISFYDFRRMKYPPRSIPHHPKFKKLLHKWHSNTKWFLLVFFISLARLSESNFFLDFLTHSYPFLAMNIFSFIHCSIFSLFTFSQMNSSTFRSKCIDIM